LNHASEVAALALVRFLVASVSSSSSSHAVSAHLARTLPFALSLLLALPFFRWRSAADGTSAADASVTATGGASGRHRRRRCVHFASALAGGLLHLASVAPPSSSSSPSSSSPASRVRVCVTRALGMLHRQCAHMTRQLPALRPARVTVVGSVSSSVVSSSAAAGATATGNANAGQGTHESPVEVWRFDADANAASMAMPTSPTLLQAPFVLLGACLSQRFSKLYLFIH
jgi:hypothetical protein